MSFKLNVVDLLPRPLDEVQQELCKARSPLGSIKFLDLLVEQSGSGGAIGMNHGVYAFFNPAGKCAYVGKSVQQGFAERIGSHFHTRPGSQGNVYLARNVVWNQAEENQFQAYARTATTMHDHSLVMVNVYGWESVKQHLLDLGIGAESIQQKFEQGGWGTQEFCSTLETALMALYCPPSDGEAAAHFLNKPNRGRRKLRSILRALESDDHKGKNLAQLLMLVW